MQSIKENIEIKETVNEKIELLDHRLETVIGSIWNSKFCEKLLKIIVAIKRTEVFHRAQRIE